MKRVCEHRFSASNGFRTGVVLMLLFLIAAPGYAQLAWQLREQVEGADRALALQAFYRQRQYEPAWVVAGRLTPQALDLIHALRQAALEGLRPGGYGIDRIEAGLQAAGGEGIFESAVAVDLDLLLTGAYLRYGLHLLRGRVDPTVLHPGWTLKARQADLVARLQSALASDQITVSLERLRPPSPAYALLQQALVQYGYLAEQGGWPALPDGPALHNGDRASRVKTLHAGSRSPSTSLRQIPTAWRCSTRPWKGPSGPSSSGMAWRRTGSSVSRPGRP